MNIYFSIDFSDQSMARKFQHGILGKKRVEKLQKVSFEFLRQRIIKIESEKMKKLEKLNSIFVINFNLKNWIFASV